MPPANGSLYGGNLSENFVRHEKKQPENFHNREERGKKPFGLLEIISAKRKCPAVNEYRGGRRATGPLDDRPGCTRRNQSGEDA